MLPSKHNLISIEPILSQVKLRLRSFDEAGLIDDTELLGYAEWILNRLDIGILSRFDLILDIENGKAETPFNLKYLEVAYKCKTCGSDNSVDVKYKFGHPHRFTVRDHTKKICYNKCCIEESRFDVTRTIELEDKQYHTDKFCDKELLTYKDSVSKGLVTRECENIYCKSPNYFTFDKNNFYFNFDKGYIFIRYYGYELGEDGFPLVQDEPNVIKAITDYLIYQSLLTIYYNAEADVLQRMQKAEIDHNRSLKEVLFNDKLPSFGRMKIYGQEKGKQFNKFNLKSKADAV